MRCQDKAEVDQNSHGSYNEKIVEHHRVEVNLKSRKDDAGHNDVAKQEGELVCAGFIELILFCQYITGAHE